MCFSHPSLIIDPGMFAGHNAIGLLPQDPSFKPHYLRYAADQGCFFREYAAAHKKLSELGSAFFPAGGIRI